MYLIKKIIFISIICVLTLQVGRTFAYVSPGQASAFVNDFASILETQTKIQLETTLLELQKKTSTEIVVATVTTLNGDSIENVANQLFREWAIGAQERNSGVLLLVAPNEKQVRIEVGYGLEGALPDAVASSIIRNDITPEFKKENYSAGIQKGVDSIINATKNEYTIPVEKKSKTDWGNLFPFLMFFFIIGWQIIVAILAPTKSWWLGGVFGGTIGAIVGTILSSMVWGAGAVVLFGLLGLGLDYFLSKKYKPGQKSMDDFLSGGTHGWGGGSFGGSGSSGGFGGFSGGSSGGGGASGSW